MEQFAQYLVNGFLTGGSFVLASLGLTLIFGVLNVVNFAHGAFYTLGAYLALLVMERWGVGFFPALLVAMAAVAIFGMLMDPLIFRRLRGRGELPTIIASMGLSLLMGDGIRLLWGAAPQYLRSPYVDDVIHLGPLILNGELVLVFVTAVVLIGALYWFIERTWVGLQIRMVAQDAMAAALMGVYINRVAVVAWAICGTLTAAAGVLIVPAFALEPSVGDAVTLTAFAVVIFGGIGSVLGTIVAGLALGISESLSEGYLFPGIRQIVAFAVLIIVLVIRSQKLRGR
ncbi:MAG TPA: branched-chain amino acid ABC transporter permease [bacterium]|nr:branched-chain amino acid ABC transporter permease [bacterium]